MTKRNGSSPLPAPAVLRAAAGFTLVELLVSLAVTTVLILGVLATFDFSRRMNQVQMNVADMQQSLRIAQNELVKLSRMAGRGSLLAASAVVVGNNVAANSRLIATDASTAIVEGTDTLTLRGVFTGSLYQIEFLNPLVFTVPDASGNGSVVVLDDAAGVPQDITALKNAATAGETLLLVTPFDTYSVVSVTATTDRPDFRPDVDGLQVDFTVYGSNAGLGGQPTPGLPAVAYVGILEEYTFYVRQGTGAGESPRLSRARLRPGTGQAYGGSVANATMDIADNILDLQAAVGFGVAGAPELRITTLARTDRRDPGQYLAPLLPATIEDHAYATTHPFNAETERRHRWRLMRTNVNLRNL